jgi:hypothetical protein
MKEEKFETSDFTLAISLCCLGFCIRSFDDTDPQRVVFRFEKKKGLYEAIQTFWNRELRVEPMTYAAHTKLLKARLYDIQKK